MFNLPKNTLYSVVDPLLKRLKDLMTTLFVIVGCAVTSKDPISLLEILDPSKFTFPDLNSEYIFIFAIVYLFINSAISFIVITPGTSTFT